MKTQRIDKYPFTAKDNLLLDTNIWLFLYCPHGDPKAYEPGVYSSAFKKILSANCKIYVSSTILGEFIYRYCRLTHELLLAKGVAPKNFKHFRKTALFKKVAEAVGGGARRVLTNAAPLDEKFASLDFETVLNSFEKGTHDFNDLLIADVCKRNKLTLITDDEDFSASGVQILTANASI